VYELALVVHTRRFITEKTRRQKEIADGMLPGDIERNARDLMRAIAAGNNFTAPLRFLCKSVVPYIALGADFSRLNGRLVELPGEMEQLGSVILPEIQFSFDLEFKDRALISIGDRIYAFSLDLIREPWVYKTGVICVRDENSNIIRRYEEKK